jgi:hypothetical protein
MKARAPSRPLRALRVTPARALFVSLALECVLHFVVHRGNGWAYDDNLQLQDARSEGLTWHWLNSLYYGHWAPSVRALFSFGSALAPAKFEWALIAMIAGVVFAAWLFYRVCLMLFENPWLAVLGGAYVGVAVGFTRDLTWISAGSQGIPTVCSQLAVLYCYLRFIHRPSARWVALSCLALAVGLTFFERPAYILPFLLLLRLLLVSERWSADALRAAWLREWPFWFASVLVLAGWYLWLKHVGGGPIGTLSVRELLSGLRLFWAQGVVPAAFGLNLPAQGLTSGQVALTIALQIAMVVVIVASIRRRPSAWRAWAFLLIASVAEVVPVVYVRGFADIVEPRFLTDFVWITPLAVLFAFATRRAPGASGRDQNVVLTLRPSRAVAVACALTLAVAGAAAFSEFHLNSVWFGNEAAVWEANLQSSIARAVRHGSHPVLADYEAPQTVEYAEWAPNDFFSRLVLIYSAGTQVDGPLDGRLYMLGPKGTALPASFVITYTFRGAFLRRLARTESRSVGAEGRRAGGAASGRPTEICASPDQSARLSWSLAITNGPGPYYLRATAITKRPAELPLSVTPTSYSASMLVRGGVKQSIVWLGPEASASSKAPTVATLEVPARSGVCLSTLEVGRLNP